MLRTLGLQSVPALQRDDDPEDLDLALRELGLYAAYPFIGGRKPEFVYFGGGTPSYLSESQLQSLTDQMKAILSWDEAKEVTFDGGKDPNDPTYMKTIGVTLLQGSLTITDGTVTFSNFVIQ